MRREPADTVVVAREDEVAGTPSGEHRGTLDIKRRGIRPLVDVARLLAMRLAYPDSPNTVDRYRPPRGRCPRRRGPARKP